MNGFDQMLFNPQSMTLEGLSRTLTAHHRDLANRLLDQANEAARTGASRHNLLVGPRGSGKTHLLTFVRKTLERRSSADPGCPIVIALSEEERGVSDLFDFLIAALRALDVSPETLAAHVHGRPRAERVEYLVTTLLARIGAGRAALLCLENLNDLLARMEPDEVPRLRAFLQAAPSVSVLATATELFAGSTRSDHPFHGFFAIHPLRPLDLQGARDFLVSLAEARQLTELAGLLKTSRGEARVRAIHDLTGGNHRLLAMLGGFLSAEGLDELVGPIIQTADRQLTPYYQQRLDRLSPQQNKLVRAIADLHGSAVSVKDLAARTFLPSQTVSRQLVDLLSGGFVRRHPRGRESFYELSEPLLRLILDMKEGRDRPLRLIVELLRRWYDQQELHELIGNALETSRAYYEAALTPSMEDATRMSLARLVPSGPTVPSPATGEAGDSIFEQGESRIESASPLQREAEALLEKGVALGRAGRSDEAIAAYEEVASRFGGSERPELVEQAARALRFHARILAARRRFDEALPMAQRARQLDPDSISGVKIVIALLVDLGRPADAVELIAGILGRDCPADWRPMLAAVAIGRLRDHPVLLRKLGDLFAGHADALASGFVSWFKSILPMTEASARALESAEIALREAFGHMTDLELPLRAFSVARRDAQGDDRAMLDLPVEVRRLIRTD